MQSSLPVAGHAPTVAAADAAAAPRGRWAALDFFRFGAVLLMVQGHAFYVVVSETVREASWYGWHGYVHGYTAPMFLFAAGLAFGITTFRRWDDHARVGKPLWRRVERYLLIIAVGYLLHMPQMSLSGLLSASPERLATFFKVDALQHIGVVLLACELLIPALRRPGRFVALVAVLGVASVLAGPFLWRLPVEGWLPTGIAAYVNDHTGSIFPLAPWSGFIFAGIVSAWLIHRARLRDRRPWHEFAGPLVTAAAALMLASAIGTEQLRDVWGEHNFWKTSPWFFLWRVGCVLLLLAGLCGLSRLLEGRRRPTGPIGSTVQVMGQETLVVYVAHLFVLYGSPLHRGFQHDWGHALGLGQSALFFLAVFVAMAFLAWGWHTFKTRRPGQFQTARLALLGSVILYVFVGG